MLAGQVEALSRRQPVLMVFEDVHWIDPTSQEALDVLVPRLQALPVLLVITYRPEYTPPLGANRRMSPCWAWTASGGARERSWSPR